MAERKAGVKAATPKHDVHPKVFTIPPGQPFLNALARAILNGDLPRAGGSRPAPLDLPAMTILLPTQRATRGLQEAFLTVGGGSTMLLPKIRAIAQGDEDLTLLSGLASAHEFGVTDIAACADNDACAAYAAATEQAADPFEIPPAVSEIERRLVLTQLVLAWSKAQAAADDDALAPVAGRGAATPAQAAKLAGELATLIDMVETENVSLDGLVDLVPEDYSQHWQRTLDFLQIVTAFWPAHLAEQGFVSAADRRNQLILGEAARLAAAPPAGPLIIAGVTGSIPATGALMKIVSRLPRGAIVLPALDQTIDDEGWQCIGGEVGGDKKATHEERIAATDAVSNGTEADNNYNGSTNDKGSAQVLRDAFGRPLQSGHPEHPQYGMKKLLQVLGVARSDVQLLPGAQCDAAQTARQSLISQAMRPAGATAHWHDFTATADRQLLREALSGVALISSANTHDEAEAVALILREAAETPGKTAALISPDRLLARRVAIRLEAWGIRVDDSAGRPFAKTVPGAFLNLVIDAVANEFAPAQLMSLLKHPLLRLGLPVAQVRRAARALELSAFRTAYLGVGLDGVEAALERAKAETDGGQRMGRAVQRLWDEDWTAARDLVSGLQSAFKPLTDLFAPSTGADNANNIPDDDCFALRDLAKAHITVAETLSLLPDQEVPTALWQGEAGEAASLFFTGLIDEALPAPDLAARDYPDLYRNLIVGQNVRSRVPVHPRLSIWGPFEARLQQADVVILGSLNEGTWPDAADPGPWLNRPMRQQLGLPSPEEKIGQAAHDFSCFLGAPQVYLTRAAKVDGVPTVPSRWLMRLSALLDGMEMGEQSAAGLHNSNNSNNPNNSDNADATGQDVAGYALAPDKPWLQWARARDQIGNRILISAPQPRPPVKLRPRALSVTAIEKWIANPYAIFAGRILKLDPLPKLGTEPGAALKGAIIHDALSRFSLRYNRTLPDDIETALVAIAAEVLDDYKAHPRVAAFWMPRFARFAAWFAGQEPGWRRGMSTLLSEVDGRLTFKAPAGLFTLRARADRIDFGDAGLIITDYKTGMAPSDKKVLSGAAPQLPLEAAIAQAAGDENGFANLANGARVTGLRYVRATGAEPPGEARLVKTDDVSALADEALRGLQGLVAAFDDEATPYKAVRRADFSYDYDDYAHLARVAEWAGHSDDGASGTSSTSGTSSAGGTSSASNSASNSASSGAGRNNGGEA